MYVSPETIELLAKLGVSGTDAVAVIRAFEQDVAAQTKPATPTEDRRRERNRRYYEAQRLKASEGRLNKTSEPASEQDAEPSPAPLSPKPPNPTPPSAECVSTPTREEARRGVEAFQRFWAEYPRKVGKPDALKAYAKACLAIGGPDPPAVILAGLRAHLPGWAQSEPEFVPHPATWLRREGWNDQPPAPKTNLPRNGDGKRPHPNDPAQRSADRLARIIAGSEIALGARRHGFGD